MPNFASNDWLILFAYLFCVFAIGLSMRSRMKTSKDFFQAGRTLPMWVCALAFVAASLGGLEMPAMGAAGAKYGLNAALMFWLGTVPALIVVAVRMMPVIYGSGARTLPEYLGLRFETKTRMLSAVLTIAMAVTGAGISLYVAARILEALRIFEPLFFAYGLPREGMFTFCILLIALPVLLSVLLAGLGGAMVNQVLQFALLVVAFVPLVWKGLDNIGGWSGLAAAGSLSGTAGGGTGGAVGAALGLGLVFGAVYWATDFRILQMAMAARRGGDARRATLFAATARVAAPLLLILPGAIAIGLPTPQNSTVVRNENGAIYHEITVVPREIAEGRGVVPARLDATGSAEKDANGQPVLEYAMATPNLMTRTLSSGLLGLAVVAMLAGLVNGLGASVTACNALFTFDLYQISIGKVAQERRLIAVGRWATVAGVLAAMGVAYAAAGIGGAARGNAIPDVPGLLMVVVSLGCAPLAATYVLGIMTKRVSGHSAFAGLAAGIAAAIAHYGLTLPDGARPGLSGGWIAVAHRYSGLPAQCLGTMVFAVLVNVLVAVAASVLTRGATQAAR